MHRRTTSAQEALAAAALPDSMPQGRAQQVTSDEEDDAEASPRAAQAHVQAAAATAAPARWNPRETVVQVNEAGESQVPQKSKYRYRDCRRPYTHRGESFRLDPCCRM